MIDPWWRADNIKHTYEGNPNLNPSLQLFSQELCRKAFLYFEQQLRGAFEEDLSAAAAALGAEVNNMVCYLDHVHIVLDHQYGIAPVHELIQHFQQMMDVFKMQTGGRLVENIKSFARVALGQLGGQLYPLRLAPTQRYGRFASSVATFPRSASPPLSVTADWPSVMYPRPTSSSTLILRYRKGMF